MRIPVGYVTTYGAIAQYLGFARCARMVGAALMAVTDEMGLPCHRVVNSKGELSGRYHFSSPTLMRTLLEKEKVEFNGEAVMLKKHFWYPADS